MKNCSYESIKKMWQDGFRNQRPRLKGRKINAFHRYRLQKSILADMAVT